MPDAMTVRAQWWIAVGLSLGPAVSNGLARFAYGLVLPAMKDDLGWSYTEAGWINTANAIGYLVGAMITLRLISRTGARLPFIVGMIATAVALCGSSMVRDFTLQVAFRILAGIGGAPAFIAGGAMAASLFRDNPARNALAIAVYFGGGGLGMVLTGAALPLLFEVEGAGFWPRAWALMSLAALTAIPPSTIAACAAPAVPTGASSRASGALPLKRMAFAMAGYFLFAVGYIVYVTFLVAWMRPLQVGSLWVAITWSVVGLGVMLSPFLWRPVLAAAHGGGALALACLVLGIGTLLPILVQGHVGLLLSGMLFGLALFIGPAAMTSFCKKSLAESQWGRAMALFTIVFAVGQTIGPVAAGAVADLTQSLSIGLAAAGVTLLLASALSAVQQRLD